jgi:NADPH-dependent glutamate synthase beta subunit-like oxidoreductase
LMSSVIPREMEELRRRQDELRKAYADVAKQRGKVLKYLNESSGTSGGKTGRVATGLAGLARDGDLIAEEVRLVSFSRSSSSPSVLL